MRCFFLLFFLPITKAFVSVKIRRDSLYHPRSSFAFISNTSLSNNSSIQSCIWQCVHEQNCQTAVYYKNEKICSMYSEFCETNRIQSLGNAASSVICYRKNHSRIDHVLQIERFICFRSNQHMSVKYYSESRRHRGNNNLRHDNDYWYK
jgi:hypothetical protein